MTSWETCACFYMSWHIFLTVVQKAVEGADTHATTHEQDLGICWLRTQLRKRETLHVMLLLFSGSFWLAGEGQSACATEIIVWCHKEKNPLLDASDVFTEASIRCREISVISEKKKKVIAFPLKVIQNTGQISPNCFSENIFLLRTKLCQSDHVPL